MTQAMANDRTAVVTGAGKRVGRVIAEALLADGWTVVAHVHANHDEAPDGAIRVAADLAAADCAERIFAATEGQPPVRLLVNNAARFANDCFGAFDATEFERHMAVNVQAPLLLIERFADAHSDGHDALIVNLLDSKLAAPNADFLSYTLSKQALAGLTELAARALAAKGIRVNGIAPGLMLRSTGQSEENFRRMHSANPLSRGVEPQHVAEAVRFLAATSTITGDVLVIDSGLRFWSPQRDLQFLEP